MESIIANGPFNDDRRQHMYFVKREVYSYYSNTWTMYKYLCQASHNVLKNIIKKTVQSKEMGIWQQS